MCKYTYYFYDCGCGSFVDHDEAEYCSNVYTRPNEDSWFSDLMCSNMTIVCEGFANDLCPECYEDWDLEFELDDDELI